VKLKLSTIIVASVTAAVVIYLALEFTGVVGNDPGRVQPGWFVILILLVGSLFRDVRRNRAGSEVDC
jgi:hypothetical protein